MMRKMLAVLGFSLVLAPLAAQAHDRDGDWDDDDGQARYAPPPAQPGGHYQWENVSQWVPAHAEQFVVPGSCFTRGGRWHHRTVCTPSRYATRIIPGHYIQSARWVWVADPQPVYPQYPDDSQYPQSPDEQYPDQNEPYTPPPAPQSYAPAPSGFDLRVSPRGVRVGIHLNTVAAR